MFTVIGCVLGGMCLGFLLRNRRQMWIYRVITILIWLLLFILGIEVGGDQRIIEGLATLGVEAMFVSLACVLGSCVFAWGLWYLLYIRKGKNV